MKIIFTLFIFFAALPTFAATEYLVKISPSTNPVLLAQIPNLKKIRKNLFVVDKKDIQKIQRISKVIHMEPNHKIKPTNIPNDLSSELWGLENKEYKNDANVVNAWKQTTGSKNIVVAVIDTGVDFTHPDLADNLWYNTKEINGQNKVDDDGNGFVDDIYGWNTVLNSTDIYDYRGHGTHVAGIIGAKGNNGKGVVGVNWNVSLMILNIFPKNEDGTIADAIKAIDYAVANGAHVINASWGAPSDGVSQNEFTFLTEAIERAKSKNIIFVAAAGNSGTDNDKNGHIPASLSPENIISVGAITRFGWVPSFSNFGETSVDVFAPGVLIKSTLANNYYGNLSGTSMAAPFVTGIIALMLNKNLQLSTQEITQILLNSCTLNPNLTKSCRCQGHIDAALALTKTP